MPIDGQPKSIVQDLENMARTYIKVIFYPSSLQSIDKDSGRQQVSRERLTWLQYCGSSYHGPWSVQGIKWGWFKQFGAPDRVCSGLEDFESSSGSC